MRTASPGAPGIPPQGLPLKQRKLLRGAACFFGGRAEVSSRVRSAGACADAGKNFRFFDSPIFSNVCFFCSAPGRFGASELLKGRAEFPETRLNLR